MAKKKAKKGRVKKMAPEQHRTRSGGPLYGTFPDVDKLILDLRKHNVSNDKRYAMRNGGRDKFTFSPNLLKARIKVIKGAVMPLRAGDENVALTLAKGMPDEVKSLVEQVKAFGYKIVPEKS